LSRRAVGSCPSFERTEVAAWMSGAEPGRIVDWKLVAHVIGLCVIPVVAVIAVQFPDAASWLARFLDPFLATVK
jgi:sugar phosphate permease